MIYKGQHENAKARGTVVYVEIHHMPATIAKEVHRDPLLVKERRIAATSRTIAVLVGNVLERFFDESFKAGKETR